jgi:hypothetical protein
MKRQPSATQVDSSHQKPTLPASWAQTSGQQNWGNKFLLFMSSGLRYLVMAVWAN